MPEPLFSSTNGSLKVGTAFGIPVRLHWTLLLIMLLFAMAGNLAILLVLVGCVLLHELGHSLVARSFGIRVIDITFWPLGGMARMSELPEVPRIEGLVAIAGPAVNFVLALLGMVAFVLLEFFVPGGHATILAGSFVGVNLLLGTFNLVPAFPMDGGRILRAWFARRTDWVTATEKAVRIGRYIALGTLLLTPLFFDFPNLCVLPLIALFVWVMGGHELVAVRMRHGLSPFGAGRQGAGGFAGFGPRPATAEAIEPPRSEPPSTAPAASGARRPLEWEPHSPRGRFTEDEIRALEHFRGRLPRRPSQDS